MQISSQDSPHSCRRGGGGLYEVRLGAGWKLQRGCEKSAFLWILWCLHLQLITVPSELREGGEEEAEAPQAAIFWREEKRSALERRCNVSLVGACLV